MLSFHLSGVFVLLVMNIVQSKHNDITRNKVTLYRSYVISFDNDYYITLHKFSFEEGNGLKGQTSLVSDFEFMSCLINDWKMIEGLSIESEKNTSAYIKLLEVIDIDMCNNHVYKDTVGVLVASSSRYPSNENLKFYFQILQNPNPSRTRVTPLYICIENTYVKYRHLYSTKNFQPRVLKESCLEFDLTLKLGRKKSYISVQNLKLKNVLFMAGSKGNFHVSENGKELVIDDKDEIVAETTGDRLIQDLFEREKNNPIESYTSKIILIDDYVTRIFNPLNQYFDFYNFNVLENMKATYQNKRFRLKLQNGLFSKESDFKDDNRQQNITVKQTHEKFEYDTFVGLIVLLIFIVVFAFYAIVISNDSRKNAMKIMKWKDSRNIKI